MLKAIRAQSGLSYLEPIAVKIQEIIGPVTPADLGIFKKKAYSFIVDSIKYSEQAKQLLEFSPEDVLDHFFDTATLRKFSSQQLAMLRNFKIILSSKNPSEGQIKGVYRYQHVRPDEVSTRQKTEVELSFAQLYALFNFLLYMRHYSTNVPTATNFGEWSGLDILTDLSDKNDLDHLNVQLVPPPAVDNYDRNLILSIIMQPLKISFAKLVISTGSAAVIFPRMSPNRERFSTGLTNSDISNVLLDLKFTKLFAKIDDAVTNVGRRYMMTMEEIRSFLEQLPEPAFSEKRDGDNPAQIHLISTINDYLQRLNLDAQITVSKTVNCSSDLNKKRLLTCLIVELRYALRILKNGNLISEKFTKPTYDKLTNTGKIVEDHIKQTLVDEINEMIVSTQLDYDESKARKNDAIYHFSCIINNPSPLLALILDNLAHGNLDISKFEVYRQEAKKLRPLRCPSNFTLISTEDINLNCNVTDLILLKTALNYCLMVQPAIISREKAIAAIAADKELLAKESYRDLFAKYYNLGKPVIVRKIAAIRCPNPYEEIFSNCDGKHIVPGALVGVNLPGCITYSGQHWKDSAGLVLLSQNIVAGFAKPSLSDRLKQILFFKPESVGEFLRDKGGKPSYSFEAMVSKMRYRSDRATGTIKDESKLQVISTYIFKRKRQLLSLELNFKDKDQHLHDFSLFLVDYLTEQYQHLFEPGQTAKDFYLYKLIYNKFAKLLNLALISRAKSLIDLPKYTKSLDAHYLGRTLNTEVLFKPNMFAREESYMQSSSDEAGKIREELTRRRGDIAAVYLIENNPQSLEDALTLGKVIQGIYQNKEDPVLYVAIDENTSQIKFFTEIQIRAQLQGAKINMEELELRVSARLGFYTERQPLTSTQVPPTVIPLPSPGTFHPIPQVTPAIDPTFLPKEVQLQMEKSLYPELNLYNLLCLADTLSQEKKDDESALQGWLVEKIKGKLKAVIVFDLRSNVIDFSRLVRNFVTFKKMIVTIFNIIPQEVPIYITQAGLLQLTLNQEVWKFFEFYLQKRTIYLHNPFDAPASSYVRLDDLVNKFSKVNFKILKVCFTETMFRDTPPETIRNVLKNIECFTPVFEGGMIRTTPLITSLFELFNVSTLKINTKEVLPPITSNIVRQNTRNTNIDLMYDTLSRSTFNLLDFSIHTGDRYNYYYSFDDYLTGFFRNLSKLKGHAYILRLDSLDEHDSKCVIALTSLFLGLERSVDHKLICIDLTSGLSETIGLNSMLTALSIMAAAPVVQLALDKGFTLRLIKKLEQDSPETFILFQKLVRENIILLSGYKKDSNPEKISEKLETFILAHHWLIPVSNEQLKTFWEERKTKAQIKLNTLGEEPRDPIKPQIESIPKEVKEGNKRPMAEKKTKSRKKNNIEKPTPASFFSSTTTPEVSNNKRSMEDQANSTVAKVPRTEESSAKGLSRNDKQ